MPIYNGKSATEFREIRHRLESEFEKVLKTLSDRIFGETSIYLDVKRRVKGKEIISIPDGYLIDLFDPNKPLLYIVENEIVGHDPFQHIGSQLLRFAIAFDDAKPEIRNLLMQEIQEIPASLKRLEDSCAKSSFRNIDNLLDAAVFGKFRGLVVIDEAKTELHRVIEKINADISVLELKTFENESGEKTFLYDTLYEEDDEGLGEVASELLLASTGEQRRTRRMRSNTVVVPAKLDGFKQTFLIENRWYAIRMSPAMKERVRYIAAYQVAPVSAITHIAEIKEIKPYQDTGKYELVFKEPAKEVPHIHPKDMRFKPQGPIYVEYEKLRTAKYLEDAVY